MDEQIRQAERSGDKSRAGLLKCRSGIHLWSKWAKPSHHHQSTWHFEDLYELLGVPSDNRGIKNGQTSLNLNIRECFWCGKRQRHIEIVRWKCQLGSETIAELIHEL